MKSIARPRPDMKTYSIIYPRGHGVRKLPDNFLQDAKLFRPNLGNAIFRKCIVMHMY